MLFIAIAAGKTTKMDEFFKDIESYEYKTWKEIMNVNLDSMFLVSKHIGSLLKRNKNGAEHDINLIDLWMYRSRSENL